MDNVKNIILEYIKKEKQVSEDAIISVDLLQKNIIDSFFMIKLVDFLENKFNIKMEIDDLSEDNFKTIEKIANLINSKL